MNIIHTTSKTIDTHLRVNTDLRSFLNRTQEFYNTHKHENTPAISINSLCNLAIISLRDHLENLSDDEARLYLSKKASEYDSLRAMAEYVYEFDEKEEI